MIKEIIIMFGISLRMFYSRSLKYLQVRIDNRLLFKIHWDNVVKNGIQSVTALCWTPKYTDIQ